MTFVKILFILSGLLLQLPSSAQNNYEELIGDALQSTPLETAQNLTNTLLTAQKAGEPHLLKETEAIAAVQEEFS
ncbi:MAG: hypothetical protein AAF223_18800, partial [Bacteroidota bacterium]